MAREILEKGQQVRIRLSGHSMFPYLRPGDFAVISHVKYDNICPGDIIAFQSEGRFILHRCIEKSEEYLICRGDVLKNPDNNVERSSVIGKLIVLERNGKVIKTEVSIQKFSRRILRFPQFYYYKGKIQLKLLSFFNKL